MVGARLQREGLTQSREVYHLILQGVDMIVLCCVCVCVYVRTHTRITCGVLRCEERYRDETPRKPGKNPDVL